MSNARSLLFYERVGYGECSAQKCCTGAFHITSLSLGKDSTHERADRTTDHRTAFGRLCLEIFTGFRQRESPECDDHGAVISTYRDLISNRERIVHHLVDAGCKHVGISGRNDETIRGFQPAHEGLGQRMNLQE